MKLIERYIIKRIAALFCSILLGCVSLTWLVEILGKINIVTTKGQSILTFLYLSLLFMPSVLTIVAPFAIAITTAQILHSLNRDSEMVIIANAGKGMLYIWRPIIVIGLIISVLLFFTANFLSPIARINMRQLMAQANASFLTNIMQEDSFVELNKGLYLKIGNRNLSSSLNDIFISDERDKKSTSYYYAKSANIIDHKSSYLLVMNNGVIAQHDNNTNENSLISFNSYNFNLSDFMPAKGNVQFFPKDLPLDKLASNKELAYKAELHYRLTSWLYPVIFTFFALIFSGSPKSYRESKTSISIALTTFSTLVFYILSTIVKSKAAKNANFIILLYLLPIISLLTIIIFNKINIVSYFYFINKKLRYRFKK